MLIKQIIKFKLRGVGLFFVHVLPQLVISVTAKKSPCKTWSGLLFTNKILQKGIYFTLLYLGQITKFNLKMQDFKRVLNLNCKLKED